MNVDLESFLKSPLGKAYTLGVDLAGLWAVKLRIEMCQWATESQDILAASGISLWGKLCAEALLMHAPSDHRVANLVDTFGDFFEAYSGGNTNHQISSFKELHDCCVELNEKIRDFMSTVPIHFNLGDLDITPLNQKPRFKVVCV